MQLAWLKTSGNTTFWTEFLQLITVLEVYHSFNFKNTKQEDTLFIIEVVLTGEKLVIHHISVSIFVT